MDQKKNIYLISSMGGSGTTSFISWFSKRIETNCSMNSEGLRKRGGGGNHKGLKHRIKPPKPDDPFLHKRIAEGEFESVNVKKALFIFDSPYNVVPSLFRRKIAMGHAKAITGSKPVEHQNDLKDFVRIGQDTFLFDKQFDNWTNSRISRPYPRMLIKFPHFWDHLEYIFDFFEVPHSEMGKFPKNKIATRNSSFKKLPQEEKVGLINIYKPLDFRIKKFPKLSII